MTGHSGFATPPSFAAVSGFLHSFLTEPHTRIAYPSLGDFSFYG